MNNILLQTLDGNVNQPLLNATPAQVQDTAEKELERSALVYVIGQ
jgi:hypothetical protein